MKVYLCITLAVFNVLQVYGVDVNFVYRIREEQAAGTVIGTTVAQDTDLFSYFTQDELQLLSYSIQSQRNTAEQTFAIDATTSELTTSSKIDREVECRDRAECEIRFDVVVSMKDPTTDSSYPHSIVRLTVVIEDINDNSPTFPESSISLTVPESTSKNQMLITSPAYDLDTGVNNSVASYEIIPNEGIFELLVKENLGGSPDLGILIKQSLDREVKDTYEFMIVAKDNGKPQRSGTLTVRISVMDDNDNKPTFTKQMFEVTVPENVALRKPILTLQAEDADAGQNGEMTFQFSARTTMKNMIYFSVDEKTGDISPIKELDYEDETQYRFLVEVKDKGTSPKSSLAEVVVNIGDVNDNAPQIIVASGHRSVSEDAELNAFVAHVNINDADSGANGEVECSVSDDHFRAEKFTFQYYKILLKKSLDFEKATNYTVNLTCTDKGDIPRSNSTSFVIKVLDVNDHAPAFEYQDYTAYMTENNQPGDIVMTISATDKDGPGNNRVTYSIVDHDADLLYINSDNGEIRTKKSIDREEYASVQFKVKASDNGSPIMSSFVMVTVVIEDINDEPPVFINSHFVFEVPEKRPMNTHVGKLSATDKDDSPKFLYAFATEEVAALFTLNSDTGEILTLREFDRLEQNRFEFSAIVRDADHLSFNDTANVTILIVEDRSMPPTILFPSRNNNSVKIPFDVTIGYTIMYIRSESTENRKVKYMIEHGNEDEFFYLDEHFGNLTIIKGMTVEDAGKYKLLVSTYFENNPGQKSFITLDLTITGQPVPEEDSESYIIIVVIIVCVTVILAGAILLAICMMKRVDRERREGQRRRKEEMEKTYHIDNLQKIADPSWEKDDKLHVMVKPQFSFQEERPIEKSIQRKASDNLGTTVMSKKIVQFAEHPIIKVEDDVSNLSGEADSGHGGSEEDFNSNARYLSLHSDSDSSQQLSPSESFDFRPETSILSSSSLREWLVETPRIHQLPQVPEESHQNSAENDYYTHGAISQISHGNDNNRIQRSVSHDDAAYHAHGAISAISRNDGSHGIQRTRSHNDDNVNRHHQTRKTSSRVNQKSVRFNIEGQRNDDSHI